MWERIKKFFWGNKREIFKNRLILYIEDKEVDRRLVEKTLIKKDYRVILASDGETGLKMAQTEKPDLILLDVILPGMSGLEVYKRLKKDPETKRIPVVFLTGMDTPKNLIDCYEYGAEDFLSKSISPRLLVHQLELTLLDFLSPSGAADEISSENLDNPSDFSSPPH